MKSRALIPGNLTTFKSPNTAQRKESTQKEICENVVDDAEVAQVTEAAPNAEKKRKAWSLMRMR